MVATSRTFSTFSLCALLLIPMLGVGTAARAGTVALWTFEDSHPTTSGLFAPEEGEGSATGSTHGTFRNDQAVNGNFIGNGSVWSFGSHTWQKDDYFQFELSTRGQKDIRLDWDQTRSQFGPADFALQYSTDDGQTFGTFALYSVLWNESVDGRSFWDSIVPRQSVYRFDFDLGGVDAIENADSVLFRLSAQEDGGIPEGSGRVDNFRVTATPTGSAAVPLPAGWAGGSITLALAIALARWTERRNLRAANP